jgi:hypothetical protein
MDYTVSQKSKWWALFDVGNTDQAKSPVISQQQKMSKWERLYLESGNGRCHALFKATTLFCHTQVALPLIYLRAFHILTTNWPCRVKIGYSNQMWVFTFDFYASEGSVKAYGSKRKYN